jgi:hypothetical protein
VQSASPEPTPEPSQAQQSSGDDDEKESLRAALENERAAHKKTQEGRAYKDLDEGVRQAAEEAAAKRANKLSWLILPPEGIKWIAGGVYLQNLFGTTDATTPYATGFGLDLRMYPGAIGIVLRGRLGGLYEGSGGVYKGLDSLSKLSFDVEATGGYEFIGVAGLHIGWGATQRSWDVAESMGNTIKLQTNRQLDHFFVFRAELSLRGALAGFTCRVGAAHLLDVLGKPLTQDGQGNTLSGVQAMCGTTLTATIAGF